MSSSSISFRRHVGTIMSRSLMNWNNHYFQQLSVFTLRNSSSRGGGGGRRNLSMMQITKTTTTNTKITLPTMSRINYFSSQSGGSGGGGGSGNYSGNRKILRSKLMRPRGGGGGGAGTRGRNNNDNNNNNNNNNNRNNNYYLANQIRMQERGSWPQARFGLRRNVPVTILPGNFNDYRKSDYDEYEQNNNNNKVHDDLQPNKDYLQDDGKEQEEEYKKIEFVLKREEERKKAFYDYKMKQYKTPKVFETKIDPAGRSYSRGARKRASARVWIQPGMGEIVVNKKDYCEYFVRESYREHILEPFVITNTVGKFDLFATVRGGGHTGQAGAIQYGAAYCLQAYNPDLYRPPLRYKGLLTRDIRKVERKKVGRVKARKSPTWVKR